MKKCVVTAVLFTLLQVAKPQEDPQNLSEAELCLRKLNLERVQIEEVLNDEENAIPEDNADLNEFAACYLQKKGYQNSDGGINFDLIIEPIVERYGAENQNDQIAEKAIEACKNVPPGNSKGQTAVKVFNCLTGNVKQLARQAN